jgi:ligand-binding SRPBCC domain-containing protein
MNGTPHAAELRIAPHGRGRWRVHAALWLPRTVDDVFPFFAAAENLNLITPPWVNFRITSPLPITMQVGARITYVIRLKGLPVTWETEITAWEPGVRFIDEQRRGPYRQWMHEHTFESADGGVWCRDTVDYIPPGGALVNRLFVQPDVFRIFSYRHQAMRRLLGATEAIH